MIFIIHSLYLFFIAKKDDYILTVTLAIQQFKCKHFDYDQIILLKQDFRRYGDHCFLKKPALKYSFLNELIDIIRNLPFHLVCVVINNDSHKKQYTNPITPTTWA